MSRQPAKNAARRRPVAAPAADPGGLPPAPRLGVDLRTSQRRRTGLTVDRIVAAAIDVLDEGGVNALSMRRVAARLGTGAASLYAHIASKEELLELIYDELIGTIALPTPDPRRWETQLRQMMHDLRRVLAAHRDAALAGLGRIPTTPNALFAAEAVVGALRAGGLSDRTVALGLDQLILHVSSTALEESLYQYGGLTEEQLARYFTDVHAFYQALPPSRYPALSSIAGDMTGHDADARFDFALDMIIFGLQAIDHRHAATATAQRPTSRRHR